VELGYNPVSKKIFINDYETDVEPINQQVHLKVIIDQTSVELYTDDGTRWITMTVFSGPEVTRELTNFG
jgi:sucrose-6-phosphate hydrolase SacC (GH32 family)